jgi:hypothetical protein
LYFILGVQEKQLRKKEKAVELEETRVHGKKKENAI